MKANKVQVSIQIGNQIVQHSRQIPWPIFEYLEVCIDLLNEPGWEICLLRLNSKGQEHSRYKKLSLAPKWYDVPDDCTVGITKNNHYYVMGTERGYTCVDVKHIEKCMPIEFSIEQFMNITQNTKAWQRTTSIPVEYIDIDFQNAIHNAVNACQKDF